MTDASKWKATAKVLAIFALAGPAVGGMVMLILVPLFHPLMPAQTVLDVAGQGLYPDYIPGLIGMVLALVPLALTLSHIIGAGPALIIGLCLVFQRPGHDPLRAAPWIGASVSFLMALPVFGGVILLSRSGTLYGVLSHPLFVILTIGALLSSALAAKVCAWLAFGRPKRTVS